MASTIPLPLSGIPTRSARRSAWTRSPSGEGMCWATAISAQPARCSKATSLDRCWTEWRRSSIPSRQAERGGARLYGRATTVGTWFIFVGPSAATVNLNADGSATPCDVRSRDRIGVHGPGVAADRCRDARHPPGGSRRARRRHRRLRPRSWRRRRQDDGVVGRGEPRSRDESPRTRSCRSPKNCCRRRRERLVLGHGRVEIAGSPGSGTTIAKVVERAQELSGPVAGSGSFTKPGRRGDGGLRDGTFHRCDRYSGFRRS